jgi:hypothetical protein
MLHQATGSSSAQWQGTFWQQWLSSTSDSFVPAGRDLIIHHHCDCAEVRTVTACCIHCVWMHIHWALTSAPEEAARLMLEHRHAQQHQPQAALLGA